MDQVKIYLSVFINWLREKCVKLRVVFIKVTRCFSLGDWVWRRYLDQSSDDDHVMMLQLLIIFTPFQSLLNVENWFSES